MKPKFADVKQRCFGLTKLPYTPLQFTTVLFFSNFIHALKYSTSSPCGNTNLTGFKGNITSPNYPYVYPDKIQCEWKIHSPAESVLKIKIVDLDIEEDRPCHNPPCCSRQWLLVPTEGGRESKILCGSNVTERAIIVSKPVAVIKYFSSIPNKGGRGFEITYDIDIITPCKSDELECINRKCVSNDSFCNGIDDCGDGSDEMHCPHIIHTSSKYDIFPRKILDITNHLTPSKVCREGRLPCPLSPDHCYSPQTDLCDGKFDCPKGDDEVGCYPGCPEQIACSSGDGCYYPSQRCNLKRNCRDNSDETGCPAVPCIALQFTCLNGACISGTAICDGDDDCGDWSDEENCTKSSFMTIALMGLLSCIFLFCIGLSCLYRVYTARLRASTGFAHQLEPEPIDDEFMYREPPPAYSVAVGDAAIVPYPNPEFMDRYFEPDQTSRPQRSRNPRHNRRRHRSGVNLEQTSIPRSRPRPSGTFTTLCTSDVTQFSESQCQPKLHNCSKNESASSRSNFEGVLELLGYPEEVAQSNSSPQENNVAQRTYHNESPCSSPSLSPSRESITSSTSLEDQEDIVGSCRS